MTPRIIVMVVALLFPLVSQAWWNEDWSYRKQMTLDTSVTGTNLTESVNNVPVLVRLHTGNFGYFLDLSPNGEDLRFIAGDDATPLKFHIEKFDPINEMALIWVQIPEMQASANTQSFWMYYGNPVAVAGSEPDKTFDVNQALVYHFMDAPPKDATAYGHNPSLFSAEITEGALIGKGVSFSGAESMTIPMTPPLMINPEKGWSWSAWIKVDGPQPQAEAVLFEVSAANGRLVLGIAGQALYAGLDNGSGALVETARNTVLATGTWQHVMLKIEGQRVSLYLDAVESAFIESTVPQLMADLVVGNSAEGGQGFVGTLDELQINNIARPQSWILAGVKAQGPHSPLILYGEDGTQESSGGPSYMQTILSNVALDGWVVVVLLAFMSAISWVVMISKGMVISRIRKDNAQFQQAFGGLNAEHIADLDAQDSENDEALSESPLLTALSGRHDHYQSSTLYRIYHAGVQEVFHRMPKSAGAQAVDLNLSNQAINAIKATMDSALIRESQKLNSQMVLLTIAIAGGPFLGLLGTVLGVMITFAAIAATGEVNVNAIAPGTAAALFTTVAGLVVAIPALFGYNYLGSRIREVSADMRVFVDEFVAKIAEQHS